jgi:hypothetical protein
LDKVLKSGEAELVAVFGRRRVGKTQLIKSCYEKEILFEITGVHKASFKDQLYNFHISFQKATKGEALTMPPRNWVEAFHLLTRWINKMPGTKPVVLFFDEFPWIHTQRSGFLEAFDHWWNLARSRHEFLKVIICGSVPSWMINEGLNNKRGLYKGVTKSIRLIPFSLAETEEYLRKKNIKLARFEVLQIYMAIGGIPFYLQGIHVGETAPQAIDKLCFSKDGLLREEFNNLYQSLFENSHHHKKVLVELAKKANGLTRNEIIEQCKFSSGGTITKILIDLEESGLISAYTLFGKKENDNVYKLTDEFCLFYLKFIVPSKLSGTGTWVRLTASRAYINWGGIAFESVCQKHIVQIKNRLGISGVLTNVSFWRQFSTKNQKGAQIDLVLDRHDQCTNLGEIKFASTHFVIDKKYAAEIDNKTGVFRKMTKTKKVLFPTMITPYGVMSNEYSIGRIQSSVVMDDLFFIPINSSKY